MFLVLIEFLLQLYHGIINEVQVSANIKHKLLQDTAQDLQSIDSCEYIWAAGVGFAQTPYANAQHDSNRTEILKLILTCLSYTIYQINHGKQSSVLLY